MKEPCYPIETYAELSELPDGHPRLRHLEQCARCRSQMILFRKFMHPSLPEDVAAALDTGELPPAVQRAVWGEGRRSRPSGTSLHTIVKRMLSRPLWRPALGLAAVVILLLVAVRVWVPGPGQRESIVLRGTDRSTELIADLEQLPGGRIRISWDALEGDVDCQVVFYDVQQQELLRLDADGRSQALFDPAALKEVQDGVLWRVIASRAGAEIARSPMRSLQLAQ